MVAGDVMKIWVKLAVCVLGTYGAFLSSAAQDVVTTVIGGGPNGLPGVDANITYPNAIAADAVGNVYIASANMGRVFKISTIGVLTVFAGTGTSGYSGDGGPAVKAGLIGPSALAVDTASPANVYISDGCLVRMVNGATGVITTVAGLVTEPATGSPSVTCGFSGDGGKANAASLSHPGGLAVNPVNNDLYVADGGNPTGTARPPPRRICAVRRLWPSIPQRRR
jgi:DNA-binding beta-propeller fold protein YncE